VSDLAAETYDLVGAEIVVGASGIYTAKKLDGSQSFVRLVIGIRERDALEEIARLAQRMIDDPLPSAVHDALRISRSRPTCSMTQGHTVSSRPNRVVMDYPTAWAFVRTTDPADHHEKCSWRFQKAVKS